MASAVPGALAGQSVLRISAFQVLDDAQRFTIVPKLNLKLAAAGIEPARLAAGDFEWACEGV